MASKRRKRRATRRLEITEGETLILREAVRAFWHGKDFENKELGVRIVTRQPEAGQYTDMTFWKELLVYHNPVAARFPASDMHLLELRAPLGYVDSWEELVAFETLQRVVAYGRMDPMNILNHVRVGGDTKKRAYWLEGNLGRTENAKDIGDTVGILSNYTTSPWKPDPDLGMKPAWLDSRYMFINIIADADQEYDRIFKPPIEAMTGPEIPTTPTRLETLQKAIDDIERDIRQLRAKEHDFASPNTEMAHRLGKQHEYEELLKQRDEHLWRENPKLPERFDKSILVGATPEEIVEVDLRIGDDINTPENQSLSFAGSTYSRTVFTAEEGEERARDSLLDGELWKDAVANGHTTEGLEEWAERVLKSDGWQQVIGDVVEIGSDMYIMSQGGGQIDMSVKADDFVELAIDRKDLKAIWQSWNKYHLKNLSKVADVAEKMRVIFEKYPAFKPEDMVKFTDMSPIEPEVEDETEPAETKIGGVQKEIDTIERDIRALRAKEKDFTSPSIEVAQRLGKRAEYERLLKERDEAMWRENPCGPIKRAL